MSARSGQSEFAEGGRWLVTGAAGQLGGHVCERLRRDPTHPDVYALVSPTYENADTDRRFRVDFGDPDALAGIVSEIKPDFVLHIGAMTAVAACHADPAGARCVNVEATAALAAEAVESGARLIFTSTDMVFDGEHAPYDESATPNPVSEYGRTKLAAEQIVLGCPRGLVVRLPLMYGFPVSRRATTFVNQIAALRAGQPLRLFHDEFRTPLALTDAADALIGLARSDELGILHVAGPEQLSRLELIQRAAEVLGLDASPIVPISRLDIESAEPRPRDLSLNGSRFVRCFPTLAPGAIRVDALPMA